MMIFGFCNTFLFAVSILSTVLEEGLSTTMLSELIPFAFAIILFVAFGFLGVLLLFSASVKRKKRVKQAMKECKTIQESARGKLDFVEKELDDLEQRMKKYIIENQSRLSFLPSDYRNPQAIGFMLKALENMRAENMKELVNLYEQELHYMEQERILSNNAEMQRIQNENMLYAMESINRNQEQMKSNMQFMQALQIISMLDD